MDFYLARSFWQLFSLTNESGEDSLVVFTYVWVEPCGFQAVSLWNFRPPSYFRKELCVEFLLIRMSIAPDDMHYDFFPFTHKVYAYQQTDSTLFCMIIIRFWRHGMLLLIPYLTWRWLYAYAYSWILGIRMHICTYTHIHIHSYIHIYAYIHR